MMRLFLLLLIAFGGLSVALLGGSTGTQAQVIPMAYWKGSDVAGDSASLRFRYNNNAYLARTFGSGNRQTWTTSFWVKHSRLATVQTIEQTFGPGGFGIGASLAFQGDDTIQFYYDYNSGTPYKLTTTNVFRDPDAWYHIVTVSDTTNAVSTDRLRLYVNGVRMTSFSVANYPSLNYSGTKNMAYQHLIGNYDGAQFGFDGYMAELVFVDGQALTPTDLGQLDADGQWVPKIYSGAYGTNGYRLDFSDSSAMTATTLGKDRAGSNNWTPANFSITANAAVYDPSRDSPGKAFNNGTTIGNYATLNPLDMTAGMGLANGNLNYGNAASGGQVRGTMGTAPSSGKWYWEIYSTTTASPSTPVVWGISTMEGPITNNASVLRRAVTAYVNTSTDNWSQYFVNGVAQGGLRTMAITSVATTDVIQVAYDAATGKLWFGRNNQWTDSSAGFTGNPSTGANPFITIATGEPMTAFFSNAGAAYSGSINFGQRPFSYAPPTGFMGINSFNQPDPAIKDSSAYFKIATYTGNGTYLSLGSPVKLEGTGQIANSLRFKPAASSYLGRTISSTTNRQTWTWSGWVKRSSFASQQTIFGAAVGGSNGYPATQLAWDNSVNLGAIDFVCFVPGIQWRLITQGQFRDPTAWYHLVAVLDTTNATAADRMRLYVNGVRVTSFHTAIYPSLNATGMVNDNGAYATLGALNYTSMTNYLDGYMADVHFVDGQALAPTVFGAFDANGNWAAKNPTGLTYGTNGYHLDFSDKSAATAAAIGKDTSGNGNNFTPANVSVTAGVTDDVLRDTPTPYNDGTNDHGNYAVFNPLDATGITFGNANLTVTGGAAGDFATRATLPIKAKTYFEFVPTNAGGQAGVMVGVALASQALGQANQHTASSSLWAINMNGNKSNAGSTAHGTSYANGETVRVAVDPAAGAIWFGRKTGSTCSWFTGDPAAGTSPAFTNLPTTSNVFPYFYEGVGAGSYGGDINFGQRSFNCSVPTGFSGLSTYSLPNTDFTPDLVIIKNRSSAVGWKWYDRLRGPTLDLDTSAVAAQGVSSNSQFAFQNGGFTAGAGSALNASGDNYVSYMFKEGATPGFDIVTYDGDASGSGRTINHSLGTTPAMVVIKGLNGSTGASNWIVQHSGLATPPAATSTSFSLQGYTNGTLYLNRTDGQSSYGFDAQVNGAGGQYVAYLFAEIPGFSKFGKYTGNGSADGTFVYTGFKPAFILVKRVDTASVNGWYIWDSTRDPVNPLNPALMPNTAGAENGAGGIVDFVSNGFKWRYAGATDYNASGGTFIYAAFAEKPFKYGTAR